MFNTKRKIAALKAEVKRLKWLENTWNMVREISKVSVHSGQDILTVFNGLSSITTTGDKMNFWRPDLPLKTRIIAYCSLGISTTAIAISIAALITEVMR